MNVNSQVQIRQLLFPSSCATPSKAFKAPNPNFDPSVRGKDRPRRWLDFELHGIWGLGAPGRLAVDVKTDKGTAAVSGAVLWSLAGKPGAAARALAERSAAAAAAGEDMSDGTDVAGSSTTCSSVDETDVGLHGAADALLMEGEETHEEDEMLGDADADGDASSGYSAASAVVLSDDQLPPEQLEQLEEEAKRSRLGKMYAAMGGGEAGLRACQALEQLIQVRRAYIPCTACQCIAPEWSFHRPTLVAGAHKCLGGALYPWLHHAVYVCVWVWRFSSMLLPGVHIMLLPLPPRCAVCTCLVRFHSGVSHRQAVDGLHPAAAE